MREPSGLFLAFPALQTLPALPASQSPRRKIARVKWRLGLLGLALAALLVPLPAALVERFYSTTMFPLIQSSVTAASNRTGVVWLDVMSAFVVTAFLYLCVRDFRRRAAGAALWRIVQRLVTLSAVLYLAFLAMWGLNYRRESMRHRVPFDATSITSDAARSLARDTVIQMNVLHDAAHLEGWVDSATVDPVLVRSFLDTTRALGSPAGATPGRPKRSMLDWYFRRASVAGMTDPFFLETLVASDLLPFERPHVIAHEWAHLAGITDEGEANFVGWLACVRGATPQQYSGWLFLYSEVLAALPTETARELRTLVADGPREDLQAIRQRYEREVSPRVSGAGWRVYDGYLKANRVDAGTASYAEVVQLILGTGLR